MPSQICFVCGILEFNVIAKYCIFHIFTCEIPEKSFNGAPKIVGDSLPNTQWWQELPQQCTIVVLPWGLSPHGMVWYDMMWYTVTMVDLCTIVARVRSGSWAVKERHKTPIALAFTTGRFTNTWSFFYEHIY